MPYRHVNRCMYIDYSNSKEAYHYPRQFMFGDLLLGAPISSPGNTEGIAEQKIWLPEGNCWYDLFTGQRYEGNQTITEKYELERFPLFIKGGYPIPMQPYTDRMTSTT